MCTLKRGRVVPLLAASPRAACHELPALLRAGAGAPSRSHHRRYSAQCGTNRCAAGTQRRAPRQYDDYPCASVEAVLTRLAHYCVDSRTRGLSHGSVREVIAFAINVERRRRPHRGDVDALIARRERRPVTVHRAHPRDGSTSPSGSRSQECAKAKIDACGIGRERHVTPAGSAAERYKALDSALLFSVV